MNSESETWDPESTAWIPESTTVLDHMGRVGGDGRGNGDEGGGNNGEGDGGADEEVMMVRILRMVWQWLVIRGPFLESPGNFSGPKSNIQIKI